MKAIREKSGFICDMDGVIYHGNKVLPGVKEFVNWMIDNDKRFVFLTNSPEKTPHEAGPDGTAGVCRPFLYQRHGHR